MRLPLSTLLSQVLVAFTIEFDNEFERLMPHRTTNPSSTRGSRQGPWLVSMVMWWNCMRFVGEEGIQVRELEHRARTKTNLSGMERWGYIVVAPDPADRGPKPPRSARLIRATRKGHMAREVWSALLDGIERRWQSRFGEIELNQLRESLSVIVSQLDDDLPDCLPILGYGLFSTGPDRVGRVSSGIVGRLHLTALLSKVLLQFAIDFERESDVSLAIGANILRVLDETGVRVRDLPLLSGVSKEAISMAMGFLQKRGMAIVETDTAASRTKIARLTAKGRVAQAAYRHLLGIIEARWQDRFGEDAIRTLSESLERLTGEPLFPGSESYPDGWRAAIAKPRTLPHYPMVLHRGGFPDGS
jgi:DNA-binding MarR family transcriptional regulator